MPVPFVLASQSPARLATLRSAGIEAELDAVRSVNPTARIVMGASPVTVDKPELVQGKKVLVVEDGPTLTHGEMKYGAGTVAARQLGAAEFIDPRPFATGEIKATFDKYPNVGVLLPAMGYSDQQLEDLETTINASGAELVVIGTPMDLRRIIDIKLPAVQVGYDLQEIGSPTLADPSIGPLAASLSPRAPERALGDKDLDTGQRSIRGAGEPQHSGGRGHRSCAAPALRGIRRAPGPSHL